jgi:7-cyano-7-deazaguanine reductase
MKIEDIAGVHLGKAGDGSAVKPYVTPDKIDSSLLVPIPRSLNRVQYNIEEDHLPFVGFDTWHAYEVSFLLTNGYPVSCIAKITYPADSEFIVESKSLKLYLNSYNMVKIAGHLEDALSLAREYIENDLSAALNTDIEVMLHSANNNDHYAVCPIQEIYDFESLDDIESENLDFSAYNESPDIIKLSQEIGTMHVWSPSLRSNCRVTNQPDWGDVYIYIKAEQLPTKESLLQYIVSMRKENHFHEEICECIYTRLHSLVQPQELFVACLYTRRGGIDINPVRASHNHLLHIAGDLRNTTLISAKTLRQ